MKSSRPSLKRDKRPLGKDPDRSWCYCNSEKLFWSQLMAPLTLEASYSENYELNNNNNNNSNNKLTPWLMEPGGSMPHS